MTVKELKKKLSKINDDVIVCLNIDRESGSVYSEISSIDKEGLDFDEPCIILITNIGNGAKFNWTRRRVR